MIRRETRHLALDAKPPEWAADEIVAIEHELDTLYPPWRRRLTSKSGKVGIVGSRGCEDLGKRARVKWLLQRRKYLYAGRDWQVRILSYTDRRGLPRMIAAPHRPRPVRMSAAQIQAAAERSSTAVGVGARLGWSEQRVERMTITPAQGDERTA